MCPPPGYSTSEDHMFCLAFSQSSLNHNHVIEYYSNEIKTKLMPGKFRYYGKKSIRKMVNISIELGLVHGDTPERNTMLYRSHLGITGKQSQYAGRIDQKGCHCVTIASRRQFVMQDSQWFKNLKKKAVHNLN